MINSAQPTPVRMKHHSARVAVAMMRMIGCNNGRYARNFLHSDCVINEKTVVLQKKDNEGSGSCWEGRKVGKKTDPSLSPSPHHNCSSLHALLPRESNRVGPSFHAVSYPLFCTPSLNVISVDFKARHRARTWFDVSAWLELHELHPCQELLN